MRRLLAEAASESDSTAPRRQLDVLPLRDGEPFVADLVLAGAGVVRSGRVADLAAFAEATGLGVLNAFTAKGLFRWDSPYHLGTGCLQERDLELAGAGAGSSVLVVGVDVDECRPRLLTAAGHGPRPEGWRSISPTDLSTAAGRVRASWGGPPGKPPLPPLFQVLWDIAQPLYKLDDGPLNPARAAQDVVAALGPDGVVCAEPGRGGWWIGRAAPTTRLGSIAIPAAAGPGAAVARALLIARGGSPALAVVEGPLSEPAAALIEFGREQGLSFVVEVWGEAGTVVDAEAHRTQAAAALATPGVTVIEVPVDWSATERLVAAAGPLAAWS